MRTTGHFTIHEFNIDFQKYGEPIYLIPFGDVHRSSNNCDVKRWHEFLSWAKTKKRAYFLGMGDYDDICSTSERMVLNGRILHDTTRVTLEDLYAHHTKIFYKEIEFMKGRLIGLVEGNHYGEFIDGTTTTQYLCREMNCKYLGVSSFIRLNLRYIGQHKVTPVSNSIDIWVHHGRGGARLIGGSINKVQQMAEIAEADIYLMGDDHKKSIGFANRLRLSSAKHRFKLSSRQQLFARTGSFLKGYVPEGRSYVVDALLNPTDLGVIKIELTPTRDHKNREDNNGREDDRYVKIHASI